MSIATKTLATIMLVAMIALSNVNMAEASNSSKQSPTQNDRHTRQLDRLVRKHDKKMEIRASILGMTPQELKEETKQKPFSTIIRKAGFKSDQAFHVALIGRLKQELHSRGWNDNHINTYIQKKFTKRTDAQV